MHVQVSVSSDQNGKPEIRPTADYHPNIWGEQFLNYKVKDLEAYERQKQRVEELKEEARRLVFVVALDDPSHQLKLIDAVQRLGLSYHFENEIEQALHDQYFLYVAYKKDHGDHEEDLYHVALRFRLLRQHGYYLSCDMFDKFKDDHGNFKDSLVENIQGMLSLYEATHLRLHGEDLLDEALVFTTTHLKSISTQLSNNNPLSDQIACALKRPLRKCLDRLQARDYISIYQDEASQNKTLLELAKLDFNIVQSMFREELSEISRWWKELDFARKLPFKIRDRIVELYFWIMGVYFEPKYSRGRRILTRIIALTSILDDTYDSFGTFEELKVFTEAIDRWDINCMDTLPEYMQQCYQAILNDYKKFEEEELAEEEKYRIQYAKEAFKITSKAYFDEARWLNQGYFPTMEEYLEVALESTCYPMLTISSFVGMGDVVTKDAFEWVFNKPKILRAATVICRYMDDVVSHKFEQERPHIPSGVECYKKQYGGSEEEIYDEFYKIIENGWKDVNQEFLRPSPMPIPILNRVLNFSRVMDFLYKDSDGYTHVGKVVKDAITAVLIDPIPI
ncbi:hypothetical protein UlMin_033437 [Ulmus minor]